MSYNGNSEFYFEYLQKLQNNDWAKNMRHSAWLDRSVFQLLKTQVNAISPMVESNMGKSESQIGGFQSGGEFLFEHMCTFEE